MNEKILELKFLQGFKTHGVQFTGTSGNQAFGNCPFCGRSDKFYVNTENKLWDCKRCGASGNFSKFLSYVQVRNSKRFDKKALENLTEDRKLLIGAFKGIEIGFYEGTYTIPIYNDKKGVQDLRYYKFGNKVKSTAGCSTGLWGLDKLAKEEKKGSTVYICEGEWDGIAMDWIIRAFKIANTYVVATPGANTFKIEWSHHFLGHNVKVIYDNDLAGKNGEHRVKTLLTGVAQSLTFTHWPPSLYKEGFDFRDLVIQSIGKTKKINRQAYDLVNKWQKPITRTKEVVSILGNKKIEDLVNEEESSIPNSPPPVVTLDEVFSTFKKWLYLRDTRAIEIAMAVILSQCLEGDPLWMFLVAPPGGTKTEILTAFNKISSVMTVSTLTSKSLISGALNMKGGDPSLIPKLNGKTLIVKDFTAIMSKNPIEKEEIFGILRDAYDGYCSKTFGNGVPRSYQSRFTFLSGVTTEIYNQTEQFQALGERFLKFRIGGNLVHYEDLNIIMKAMDNVNQELTMRDELSDIVRRFLEYRIYNLPQKDGKIEEPLVSEEIRFKIAHLAKFGAKIRGVVSREKFDRSIIISKPSAEIGTRLSKQVIRATMAIALFYGRDHVNEYDYKLARKIVLDTISQRLNDIIRYLVKETPTIDDTLSTKDIAKGTRYTGKTIDRLLSDMHILKIITRTGSMNSGYRWTLSKSTRSLIQKSELYSTEEELHDPDDEDED